MESDNILLLHKFLKKKLLGFSFHHLATIIEASSKFNIPKEEVELHLLEVKKKLKKPARTKALICLILGIVILKIGYSFISSISDILLYGFAIVGVVLFTQSLRLILLSFGKDFE